MQERLRQYYQELLGSLQNASGQEELSPEPLHLATHQVQDLHALWHAGQLGAEFVGTEGEHIHIRHFGVWNRGEGPDFLRVECECDGAWLVGDALIDTRAHLGSLQMEGLYRETILYFYLEGLCKTPALPSPHLSRISIAIPEDVWRQALQLPRPLHVDALAGCQEPLAEMSYAQIKCLLQAAAAHRMACKREQFQKRAAKLGTSQAWYECWAESLGYYHNRRQMRLIAQRLPLTELRQHDAEALLLGVAGFLPPFLDTESKDETHNYHRQLWDIWWSHRSEYEWQSCRQAPWHFAALRPANHPHRRLIALALTAKRWDEFETLLQLKNITRLEAFCKSLEHPYWTYHSALPSQQSFAHTALVGKERFRAFLINHLLVYEDSPAAWEKYLSLKEPHIAGKIQRLIPQIMGTREDVHNLMRFSYAQQGLLQLALHFSLGSQKAKDKGSAGQSFALQLSQWLHSL